MILARALILIGCVLAVSACGSATTEQSADQAPVAFSPSPRIEAIDEPAEAWWLDEPGDPATASITTHWCLEYSADSEPSKDQKCPSSKQQSEQLRDKLRAQEEEFRRATTPAKGSEPRAIAQLRLAPGSAGAKIRLIAWKTTSGKLCLANEESDGQDDSGGGPFGPCEPGVHCEEICLTYSGNLVGKDWVNTAAGVFPADADVLRVTLDDGRVASYRLDGPLVPGFPEYRAFLLDLGHNFETRLELLDGDQVLAEEKRSDAEIRVMRCDQQFPPPAGLASEEREKSPLMKCLDRAAAK